MSGIHKSPIRVEHIKVWGANWTCKDVSGGYSTFCDNVWPIWDIDWVNTAVIGGCIYVFLAVWAGIIGIFQSQKKEAFLNP